MSIPLIERPQMQPILGLLKREGWILPLLGLTVIRGIHGLPAAFHTLFSIRKSDIQSYEAIYSRHDLWVLNSGLLSLISAVVMIFVIGRWIRIIRTANQSAKRNKQESESGRRRVLTPAPHTTGHTDP